MAIIRCTRCRNKISNKVRICPNCGYKIKKCRKNIKLISSIFMTIIFLVAISVYLTNKNITKANKEIIDKNKFTNIMENNNYILTEATNLAKKDIAATEYYFAKNGKINFTYIVADINNCKDSFQTLKKFAQETMKDSKEIIEEKGRNYEKFKIQLPENNRYVVCSRIENSIIYCELENKDTKDYVKEIDYIYKQLGY